MSGQKDIFFEEWRACLHAHYVYVVSIDDHLTEATLRQVLLEAGVSETDIEAWYREATQQQEQS